MNIVKCIGAMNKIEGYTVENLESMLINHNYEKINNLLVLEDPRATTIKCIKHYYTSSAYPIDHSKEPDTDRVCYAVRKQLGENGAPQLTRIDVKDCARCHQIALGALSSHDGGLVRNTEAIKRRIKKGSKKKKKRLIL